MKLHSFATNRTLLTFDDGTEIFFSYETPVAGYSKTLHGYFRTNEWYSSTTTRHINKYLVDYANVSGNNTNKYLDVNVHKVDQSQINNLISTQIPSRY